VSWLCDDHTATESVVVAGSLQRAMTAYSPRCRRTIFFKDCHDIDWLARVGWRFADGDGYQSNEPMKLINVPFPIFSAQRFPGWEWRTPLLYMFRLFGSPVSWVRLIIGACTLRAQWTSTSAVRRLRSLTGESAGIGLSFLAFFLNNWTSPIGCRLNEG
jgi:hypothetical protein